MPPRLPPALRETVGEWLERVPDNRPRRPFDVFPGPDQEALRHRARCSRLIARGALIPEPRLWGMRGGQAYTLSDWTIADLLNAPPTPF